MGALLTQVLRMARHLKISPQRPYTLLTGVGGVGTGMFFALEGDPTLGRNESRPGRLLDVRDYCKLHIISHYIALLLGADRTGSRFRVLPIGKVGDDANGHRLLEEMAASGQDTTFVETVSSRPTLLSVCFQYPDASGGNITTSNSAAALLSVADVERVRPILEAASEEALVLAAPEVPLAIRAHLLKLGTETGACRLASFTSAEMQEASSMGLFRNVDLLAINEDEGGALVGCEFDPSPDGNFLTSLADYLRRENPAIQIVLSAGSVGAYAFDGRWTYVPALDVEVANTGGAGDALFGGTVAGMVAGMDLKQAVQLGVLLAGYSVTSPHTIHPEADLEHLLEFAKAKGIPLHEGLQDYIEAESGT